MTLFRFVLSCGALWIFVNASAATRNSVSPPRGQRKSRLTPSDRLQQNDLIRFAAERRFMPHSDAWSVWLEELRSSQDIKSSIRKALDTPSWWQSWETLSSLTRDGVVKRLLPVLLGDGDDGWRLHCSDAYRLCQSDNNCRWKYWNYARSCSSGSMQMEWPDNRIISTKRRSTLRYRFQSQPALSKTRMKRSPARNLHRRKIIARRAWVRRLRMRDRKFRQRHRWSNYRRGRKPTFAKRLRASLKNKSNRRSKFKPRKEAARYLFNWMGRRWKNVFKKTLPLYDEAQCSSNCLDALILLNNTVYGALLARCDCQLQSTMNYDLTSNSSAELGAGENRIRSNTSQTTRATRKTPPDRSWNEGVCRKQQAIAVACRPRLFKSRSAQIGCTESRIRCGHNPMCRKAQDNFLLRCSQVISGVTCTSACRDAMLALEEQSKYFGTCVCDGVEATTCQKIRSNIYELCARDTDCEPDTTEQASQRSAFKVGSYKSIRCRRARGAQSPPPQLAVLRNGSNCKTLLRHYLTTLLIILFSFAVSKS